MTASLNQHVVGDDFSTILNHLIKKKKKKHS